MLQLLKPARLETVLRNKRNHHNEKPAHHNEESTSRQSLGSDRRAGRWAGIAHAQRAQPRGGSRPAGSWSGCTWPLLPSAGSLGGPGPGAGAAAAEAALRHERCRAA
ncbi:hypothetical protein J1605_000396 [Eschrichtius robustus]|uniref:Uncharacterized protein n=1 Tax=Eschrichtius robustus TaxID=9764 RepID=A0AB34HC63_ESCRO|nr:hypothetical protein J1605_000396 [Eschrichtius robustus]